MLSERHSDPSRPSLHAEVNEGIMILLRAFISEPFRASMRHTVITASLRAIQSLSNEESRQPSPAATRNSMGTTPAGPTGQVSYLASMVNPLKA